jgi:VanZ family protein
MLLKYLWPSIVWSLVILVITLTPGERLPEVGFFQVDKLVHFIVFGLLVFLTLYGSSKAVALKQGSINPILISLVYSIGLGILVEILQLFVPGRSFSLVDILANTIGTILGYYAFRYAKRKSIF